jgi:hypothetical protein
VPAENAQQPLPPAVAAVLARARIVVEPAAFAAVRLPRHEASRLQHRADQLHSPFLLRIEARDVSLVCRATEWRMVGRGLRATELEEDLRLVTVDADVGAEAADLARVIRVRLAASGVDAESVATFRREHVLVRERDLDRTLAALRDLAAEAEGA